MSTYNVNKRESDIFNLTDGFTKNGNKNKLLENANNLNTGEEVMMRCNTPYKYGRTKNNKDKDNYSVRTTNQSVNGEDRNKSIYNRSLKNFNINKSVINGNNANNLTTFSNKNNFLTNEDFGVNTMRDFASSIVFDDYPMDFNQSLNEFNRSRIHQKINNREALTKNVSQSIDKYRTSQKDAFTDRLMVKPSVIDDRYDSLWEGAKEKNKKTETIINKYLEKFINYEPPKMTHNFPGPSGKAKELSTRIDDPNFKKLYHLDLLNQISIKRKEEKEKEEHSRRIEKEKIDKTSRDYKNYQIETNRKIRDINQSLIYSNLKMVNEKRQKEMDERKKERKETILRNELIKEKFDKDRQITEVNRFNVRRDIENALDSQIQRKRTENLRKDTNKNNANSNVFKSQYDKFRKSHNDEVNKILNN